MLQAIMVSLKIFIIETVSMEYSFVEEGGGERWQDNSKLRGLRVWSMQNICRKTTYYFHKLDQRGKTQKRIAQSKDWCLDYLQMFRKNTGFVDIQLQYSALIEKMMIFF